MRSWRRLLLALGLVAGCATAADPPAVATTGDGGADGGPRACLLEGEACGGNVTCCRGGCFSGVCSCLSANHGCSVNEDCCSGFCQAWHVCGCSAYTQTPCVTDADCCGNLACADGYCQP